MGRTLLVEVPFTQLDVPSLEVSLSLWEMAWPCRRSPRPPRPQSLPDLIFAFNSNISDARHSDTRTRVHSLLQKPVLSSCFDRVRLESAFLLGSDDIYDKRRLTANWTVGPNNLFFTFLQQAAKEGYRFMAQLEPDIIPIRPLWLEEISSIARRSTAWVVGSPFLSLCAHNVQSGGCTGLGTAIKFHLNGNALYAVGDPHFQAYWRRAFGGELRLWPFDLALHKYLGRLPAPLQRQLSSKFRASQHLLNFGGEVLPEGPVVRELQHSTRAAFLLHSSWAFSFIRKRPVDAFARLGIGAAAPSGGNASAETAQLGAIESQLDRASAAVVLPNLTLKAPADGAAAPPSARESELVRLARRQAGGGALILTFVTSAYDELCSNFVAHLRRASISAYLLVTFNEAYKRELERHRQPVHLHELKQLRGGGSDEFASRDFFLVNSARYSVLTTLLRAGIDIFSMDLDVVLLRDPRPLVTSLPYELLLQSDARDSDSQLEHSPFLVQDRLHLDSTAGVSYVNGGVFFARGTYAVARLFEDTWSLVSEDLGSLNEQDCLNRMLIASNLRWAPLPPALFPNGFVFFRRPFDPKSVPRDGPMLVHCNWINSIAAKRFLLLEVLLWLSGWPPPPPPRAAAPTTAAASDPPAAASARVPWQDGTRFLWYSVGSDGGAGRSIGEQVEALRAAMVLALYTNRTLILRRFAVLPGQHALRTSHAEAPPAARRNVFDSIAFPMRVFTFYFEYSPFLKHFPQHRESSLLDEHWPQGPPQPTAAPRTLDAVRQWRDTLSRDTLLHVRFDPHPNRLTAAALAHALDGATDPSQQTDWPLLPTRLLSALRPAPELRIISEHILSKLRARVTAINEESRATARRVAEQRLVQSIASVSRERGKRRRTGAVSRAEFNCLYATPTDLGSAARLRQAAGMLPRNLPTLLVTEEAVGRTGSPASTADEAGGALGSESHMEGGGSLAELENENGLSLTSTNPLGSTDPVGEVFDFPFWVGDFYPYWDAVEVLDSKGHRTLAYDLIQQLVCSAASVVQGDPTSDFVVGVCHWQRANIFDGHTTEGDPYERSTGRAGACVSPDGSL